MGFHHGLRCTNIHEQSAAVTPSPTSVSTLPSLTSTASDASETLDSTQLVEPSFNGLVTPSTYQIKVPPPAVEATASQTSQEAEVAPVIASSTAPMAAPATTVISNTPSDAAASPFLNIKDDVNTKTLPSSHSTHETTTQPSEVKTTILSTSSYSPTTPVYTTNLPTINATTSFTLASTTTGSIPSQTRSLREPPASSKDSDGHVPLRTILGSVFGGTAFLILVLLICLLILRNRRKSKDGLQGGGSEKPLPDGRRSPDSATGLYHGYRSGGSNASASSSNRSLHNYTSNPNLLLPIPNHDDNQQSNHFSNPFSDSAGTSPTLRPNAYHIRTAVRYPFLDDDQSTERSSLPRRPASLPLSFASSDSHRRPGIPFVRDEGSMYGSDRSLGSTIILPGRSSSGSSLRRFSYGASAAELGLCSPKEPLTRISTHSDPFDLEFPAKVMDRDTVAIITRTQV